MKKIALLLLLLFAADVHAEKIVGRSMGGDLAVRDASDGAVLRTMGGDIRVTGAGGSVVAKTMGGNIEVTDLTGSLDAGTMGGNVVVEVIGGGTGRELLLRSMGGEIELTLPKDFAGDFEVELEQDDEGRQHRIISDFPLQIRESTKRRWLRGSVGIINATGRNGGGGNRIKITTIGADIRIRRK